ncbi:MAG: EAL domain-containing protein [Conexibacter sp.]
MSDGDEARPAAVPAARLIDRRGRCRLAYEPIADLARGTICGYEALTRFEDGIDPEQWRVEATRRGLEPDLDAFVIGSVLQARESLPSGCFLTFNIRTTSLLRERVQLLLGRAERLDGLVVELCPHFETFEAEPLSNAVASLRRAGATVAIDGVGGDVGVLPHAVLVRPDFVKLDAQLVAGVHRDDAKLALVEGIGQIASRFDAWVVAQGVELIAELDALMSVGVPLAQGPLIGVRAKTLTPVAFVLSAYVRERGAAMREPGELVTLLERVPAVEADGGLAPVAAAFVDEPELQYVVLVDAHRRPVHVVGRPAHARGETPAGEPLLVTSAAAVAEVAKRAMLRPPETRFQPLVCCDAQGCYVGIVRIERLVAALADAAAPRER